MEKESKMNRLFESAKKGLATHFVDSTALMVASTPVFAGFETTFAGISDENSLNARLLATGLTYLGMGSLFTKGMDFSRKLFNVGDKTSEKMKQVHDTGYAIAYNAVIGPAFYYAAGVTDLKQMALGTLCGMGLAVFVGGPMGYAVDAYRDLSGIKDSERLPNVIKRQSRAVKLGLAGLLAAASVGLTAGVYHLTPDKQNIEIIQDGINQE